MTLAEKLTIVSQKPCFMYFVFYSLNVEDILQNQQLLVLGVSAFIIKVRIESFQFCF